VVEQGVQPVVVAAEQARQQHEERALVGPVPPIQAEQQNVFACLQRTQNGPHPPHHPLYLDAPGDCRGLSIQALPHECMDMHVHKHLHEKMP
jgi:hypothetical protein